jgi:hypothetical protein
MAEQALDPEAYPPSMISTRPERRPTTQAHARKRDPGSTTSVNGPGFGPRRWSRVAVRSAASLAAAGALLSGCGNDGEDATEAAGSPDAASRPTKTFTDSDFDITFQYPAGLDVRDDVSFGDTTGSTGPEASAGAKLGPEDFFAVQRFALNTAVTEDNLEQFIPEADAVFGELAGEEVTAEQLEVGGLPALHYEFGPTEPNGGATRATLVFDGDTEYLFTCKSTEAHSDEINGACDVALETLEPR